MKVSETSAGKKKPGLPPGSLIFTGEKKAEHVLFELFTYDESEVTEQKFDRIEDCLAAIQPSKRTWLNIDGLHDEKIVEQIGAHFSLHSLMMEDILHTDQRPRVEEFEDAGSVFIVSRMVYASGDDIRSEQLSFVLGKNFVLTFQEQPGDVLNPVRERLRAGKGRLRSRGCDYLTYALLDMIVDHHFLLLESYGNTIETIEESIVESPKEVDRHSIHSLKQGLLVLRRSIWPMREVVAQIERGDFKLFQKSTRVYIRDLYGHIVQAMDSIESYRDALGSLHDMYMTFVSNKMNEIMKVLTVIATIFIPLTFLAGIYGMNFNNMPELHWKYGYFIVLGLMVAVAVLMLVFFRRRRWL